MPIQMWRSGGDKASLVHRDVSNQRQANAAASLQSTEAAKVGTQAAKAQLAWQAQDRAAQQAAAGGVGDSMQRMIENYNLAFGEAKEANEARYQQQLGIADATTGQRAADIRSDFGRRAADITQQQQRLGMGNTTVGQSLQLGNRAGMQASLDRSADQLQQTKLGIIGGREDSFPDLGSLQSTLAGAASGTITPQVAAMLKAFGNIRSV